jgi:hypothetical protein
MTMKIIPYDVFTLHTHLRPQEIAKRLKTHTEERKAFRLTPVHSDDFEGEIDETGFALQRVAHFNQSFYPVAEGDIESGGRGAIVKIRMRLNTISILFALVWFGILSFIMVAILSSDVLWGLSKLGLPILMLIAAGILLNWSFWPEAKLMKAKIVEVLTAKIHSDTECLSCKNPLPIGIDKCPHCGWTYKS